MVQRINRTENKLDIDELEDKEAAALQQVVKAKEKDSDNIVHPSGLEEEDAEAAGGAKIIDLMAVLKKSLSKNAVVTNAQGGPPISLAERREQRAKAKQAPAKRAAAKRAPAKKKKTPARKTTRKRAKRA